MTYFSLVLETIRNTAKQQEQTRKTVFDLGQLLALAHHSIAPLGTNKAQSDLTALLQILLKSPTADSLLAYLKERDVRLGVFDTQGGFEAASDAMGACFIQEENTILLPYQPLPMGKTARADMVLGLAHMARRAWQYHEGKTAQTDHPMLDFIKTYRAEEADAVAVTALVAWELRQAREETPWQSWIASPKGDIPLAFAEQIDENPRNAFNGEALKSAYEHWGMDIERQQESDERAMLAYGYETHALGENLRFIPSFFHFYKREDEKNSDLPDFRINYASFTGNLGSQFGKT